MEIRPIKTKKDYLSALQRFETIFQAKQGAAESDESDILALLIKDYEDKHFVIDAPDPIEAIKYRMEQMGISDKDLADILGYKSKVSEILNKNRKLNLKMIRILNEKLNIPFQALVPSY